jgi:hypothetical protein
MDRRAVFAVSVVFLTVILAPGAIQTVFELRHGQQPQALDVFRQRPAAGNLHAYERNLERSSFVIKQLRPWVQYAEWRFLGDAGEQAVLGRDGWLFYRPSVRYATEKPNASSDGEPADPLPAIRSFRDQLAAQGIQVLLVPVPNKESVYPEMLTNRAKDAGVIVSQETRRLFDHFERSGIHYVDLFEVFRRAEEAESRSNRKRLYLARDSHWSPEGAKLAALAVARRVALAGIVKPGEHAYAERSVAIRHRGDLVDMMKVPQIERALEPDNLECQQVVQSDSNLPYRDAAESEILILGDSFLRVYEQDEPGAAGFVAHLARELKQPLSTIVNDGGASTLVRQALTRRPALLLRKKLVIWEFAEREIRFGTEGWQIVPLAGPEANGEHRTR